MTRRLPALALLAACATDPTPPAESAATGDSAAAAEPDDLTSPIGGDRPAPFFLPTDYGRDRTWPLVVQLHGYAANGGLNDLLLQTAQQVDDLGFILVRPEGSVDAAGEQFWNAGPVCCNFYGSDIDDVAYLRGIIDEASTRWAVDPDRVYVIGHSNGGYMSYRMACEASDVVAGIMNLAGDMSQEAGDCGAPVSVLHVHGTDDTTIPYDGGGDHLGNGGTPGARASVELWSGVNQCSGGWEDGGTADFVSNQPGAETLIERRAGCAAGTTVELWTIQDGVHVPLVTQDFMRTVLTELFARPRGGG